MPASVREGFAVGKQETQNFDFERFKSSKVSELEIMKQYQINL